MEPGLASGCSLAKRAGKRMKACLVVLSVSVVLYVCSILLTLLMLWPCAKAIVTWLWFVAYHLPFLLIWWPAVCLTRNKQLGCLAIFEKLHCYYFCSSILGVSFHFIMHKCYSPWPTWPTSACLNWKSGWRNSSFIHGFSFLVMDGAEKRTLRGERNGQRAVSAGKRLRCFKRLQDIG